MPELRPAKKPARQIQDCWKNTFWSSASGTPSYYVHPALVDLGVGLNRGEGEQEKQMRLELHKRPIDFIMTLLLGSSRYIYQNIIFFFTVKGFLQDKDM